MNRIKQHLIKKARDTHKHIFPCMGKASLAECFTSHEDKLLFWFNTVDQSTHMIIAELVSKSK